MGPLEEIDREIRRLTGEGVLSRPFVCRGSPIGCEVAEIGINPGTDTPFWPYWSVTRGFDKAGWLADYLKRNGRLKPTRDRIEVLCHELAPLRCLELNLFHHYSKNEGSLSNDHRNTALFDFMLRSAKPRVLLVHGNKPIDHLERLLEVALEKGAFTSASYEGSAFDIFVAERHFAYVSREYVISVARLIKERVGRAMHGGN